MSELYQENTSIINNTKLDNSEKNTTTLNIILQEICEANNWNYAEIWILDNYLLRCHPAHYMTSPEMSFFRKESEDVTFGLGAGLPGRVWLLKAPEWIENVSEEPAIYYRSDIAKKVGLKTGLGVPILTENEVIGVAIFYRDQSQLPKENLIYEIAQKFSYLSQSPFIPRYTVAVSGG